MEQVRRDHLISHVLAAISFASQATTWCSLVARHYRAPISPKRLSEDIDLIARGARGEVAEQIERAVRRGPARSHGRATWQPAHTATTGSQPAALSVLGGDGYSRPTEVVDIEQRYSDPPPARLRVFTADGFVAAKLGAWMDRGTPRDLDDLWAKGVLKLIGPSALQVFIAHEPFGKPLPAWVFGQDLDEGVWTHALGQQTHLRVSAREAKAAVRQLWLRAAA